MRQRKITQKEFEKRLWRGGSSSVDHDCLCLVFNSKDFDDFWKEVNSRKRNFAWQYFKHKYTHEEAAMFRLMIAQEFIKQFNEGLK